MRLRDGGRGHRLGRQLEERLVLLVAIDYRLHESAGSLVLANGWPRAESEGEGQWGGARRLLGR